MASNYTENYQLPLWAADDAFLRAEFNDANEKIDAAIAEVAAATPQIVCGEYDGDATNLPANGGATKEITLGFRPKALIITTGSTLSSGANSAVLLGDFEILSGDNILCKFTNTGFLVGSAKYGNSDTYPQLNTIHQHYRYMAIG